ncbi:VTT domain-containing protein [Streptomyces sp. ME01-18a]|uniref:DedA family protein n=1 Tax=unclassified Streptomyces TaxID=2593676 RepID=UPI0029BA7FD9|nr:MULTISPECIES: VTT domain-containing protein [unclassified Streptomyces]MDX3429605.1 VTT domain-containing protein [Streptomyces sp. ME01-18a]MDX3686984.1 VTT domain-containing protein [Streptomyces sp. AK04-4c]
MNTLALGPSWLDPDYLLNTFGLPGLLLIVFAESGLLIGFFLPGDSLLFTTGLLVTTGDLKYPLWLVCVLVALAAIIGDQVGYLFGRKVGPALFKRPDSRLFKQENVEKAHEFFEKYGPKSLVLARFVPIVRTFTPIIAGVSRMNYRSFITFNIIGGVLWGVGVTLLGAALGKIDFVHQNIEMILILIVLISVVPIAIEFLRARSRSKKEAAQRGDDQGPSDGGPEAGPHGGADGENEGPAAYRYTADQAAPYGGGYDSRYGTTGRPGEYGGQGAPYGNGQPGPYGGAQDDQQGGAPYGGPYGTQQPGGQDAGYGAQYGTQQGGPYGNGQPGQYGGQYGAQGQYGADQGGGQYGGADQGGQHGGQYDGGAQYGTQGARYGGAQQAGQYGGQQPGPYGGQQPGPYGAPQGGGQQYGGNQAGAPYDNGQAAPYGTGQAAPYAGGQPGPYDDGNSYGERPADGRGDAQEEDPGPYGWQNRR